MKKVKLMLLSLSILAIVGAALAFTVKTGTVYCTAPTILDDEENVTYSTFCTVTGSIQNGSSTDNIATTTTSGILGNPCPSTLRCFTTNPAKTFE